MCFDTLQVKNPSVDLPIGIVGSLVVCAFLYALMCVVICLMVPYDQVRPPATAFCYHRSQYYLHIMSDACAATSGGCLCIALG